MNRGEAEPADPGSVSAQNLGRHASEPAEQKSPDPADVRSPSVLSAGLARSSLHGLAEETHYKTQAREGNAALYAFPERTNSYEGAP